MIAHGLFRSSLPYQREGSLWAPENCGPLLQPLPEAGPDVFLSGRSFYEFDHRSRMPEAAIVKIAALLQILACRPFGIVKALFVPLAVFNFSRGQQTHVARRIGVQEKMKRDPGRHERKMLIPTVRRGNKIDEPTDLLFRGSRKRPSDLSIGFLRET